MKHKIKEVLSSAIKEWSEAVVAEAVLIAGLLF
jgi:hypothetical protein